MTDPHGRPAVLPAPPATISRVQHLRADALEIITTLDGRTDEAVHSVFLRGLDAEHPETVRRAWDAACADYESAHPRRVLLLDEALRQGLAVEVDADGARVVEDAR